MEEVGGERISLCISREWNAIFNSRTYQFQHWRNLQRP